MGLPLACKRGERSMKRLAIYCGSATPGDPRYIELAREVGRTLAERGIGVVYGGGRLGLMGAIADSARDAGGEVIGVIPQAPVNPEVADRGLPALHDRQSVGSGKRVSVSVALGGGRCMQKKENQ